MSRGTWEATVAQAEARGAARKAARARRAERLSSAALARKRDRRAILTRDARRERSIRRMVAEVRALPPELAQAYREASPAVRLLIREQARDARVPFVTFEPDLDRVLAFRGAR